MVIGRLTMEVGSEVVAARHHSFAESAAAVAAVIVLAGAFVVLAHSFTWVVALVAAIALLRMGSSGARPSGEQRQSHQRSATRTPRG